MLYDNLTVGENGHLYFAGHDTISLAEKYGTPLYLMDEERIRARVREYKNAMAHCFSPDSVPEYASKAFSCKQIYRIMAEEGVNIDVVSVGEIHTALAAGFPLERCFFHGNNKTDYDIAYAIDNGVGCFVVDSLDELAALQEIAASKKKLQKAILRITPGIDPHTHKKISTGSVNSKFGIAIETGAAKQAVKAALKCKNIKLMGFHCHVGSQIFDSEPFTAAAEIMLQFIADMKQALGYTAEVLNLGGGFGVRYTESDPTINYGDKIAEVAAAIKKQCAALNIEMPRILAEPGRSIVADSGITLYTVGSVKEIEGHEAYVSVDGGMTDNPRYTLYASPYTVLSANNPNGETALTATVAGRCCESGDIIQEHVKLPQMQRGDILAVLTTGAYNYSMASNYNRIGKPPVIMINGEKAYVAVKRETVEDICRLDI